MDRTWYLIIAIFTAGMIAGLVLGELMDWIDKKLKRGRFYETR